MAQSQSKETFKNATIDVEEGKIVEDTKDGTLVYSLESFLARWNGVEGVTINIGKNKDLEPDETEY